MEVKTRWAYGGYGLKLSSFANPSYQYEYVETVMDLYRRDKSVIHIYEKAFVRKSEETDKGFMRRAAKQDYNDHLISRQFLLKDRS